MRNKLKLGIMSVAVMFLTFLVAGCDLDVRPKFVFDKDVGEQITFGSMTPWEFIQSNPKKEYDYLKEAIELTGLQELYNGKGDRKTYFFLKDTAWAKVPNGLLNREFGGGLTKLNDPAKVNINKLRNVLRYHILTLYLDQSPEFLPVSDKSYIFSTYYTTGEVNLFSVARNKFFNLRLNASTEFPATKKVANVSLHNYIFSDGNSVAHVIEDYCTYSTGFFNTNP